MHHHSLGLAYLFIGANTAIAAGYISVPFLVLPYLPITRLVLWFGIGFFAGCASTHLWMMTVHPHASVFWTVEHVVQAVCTWGFILAFRRMLQHAQRRRARGGGGR